MSPAFQNIWHSRIWNECLPVLEISLHLAFFAITSQVRLWSEQSFILVKQDRDYLIILRKQEIRCLHKLLNGDLPSTSVNAPEMFHHNRKTIYVYECLETLFFYEQETHLILNFFDFKKNFTPLILRMLYVWVLGNYFV